MSISRDRLADIRRLQREYPLNDMRDVLALLDEAAEALKPFRCSTVDGLPVPVLTSEWRAAHSLYMKLVGRAK